MLQDVFHLETPGGGGFGPVGDRNESEPVSKKRRHHKMTGSVYEYNLVQESA